MNLLLKPEHQQLIEAQLKTGRYQNPDEIIAEALELLGKRDQYQQWIEEIGTKIDVAAQQRDRTSSEKAIAVIRQ
jgi:antitoxin ParD1/3/4